MSRPTVMWPKEFVKQEYRSGASSKRQYTSKKAIQANKRQRAKYHAKKAHPVIQPCEKCGNPDAIRHHDDYDKPTEIRWLCRVCHDEFHALQSPTYAIIRRK